MSARTAKDVIADWLCDRSDRAYSEAEGGANSILSALRSAGFAVVPVEPTEGMRKAGENSPNTRLASHVWRAMLKAAQEDSRE